MSYKQQTTGFKKLVWFKAFLTLTTTLQASDFYLQEEKPIQLSSTSSSSGLSFSKQVPLGSSFLSKKRPVSALEERIAHVTQAEPDAVSQVRWRLTPLLESLLAQDAEVRGHWNSLWKNSVKAPELLLKKSACRDILKLRREQRENSPFAKSRSLFVLDAQHPFFTSLYRTTQSIKEFETLLQERQQAKTLTQKVYKKAASYLGELSQFYIHYRERFIEKLKTNELEEDILHSLEPKAILIAQGSRFYRISQEIAHTLLQRDEQGDLLPEEGLSTSSSSLKASSEEKSASNHRVSIFSSTQDASLKIFFKNTGRMPLNPFREFMLKSLYDLLDIAVPDTEIIFLHNVKFHDAELPKLHALQASRGVIGITGKQLLTGKNAASFVSSLDPIHYAHQVLGALLTCPSDGKPDNFIYTALPSNQYGLVSIDNDEVFKAPLEDDYIHLKSLLFCLPLMENTTPQEVQRKFEQLVPEFTVLQWLDSWRQQNGLYKSLLQAASFQVSLSQEEVDMAELFASLSLELSAQGALELGESPTLANTVTERLKRLKLYLKDNHSPRLQEVFSELYPVPSAYYKALKQKFDRPYRAMEALYGVLADSDQTDYTQIKSLLPTIQLPFVNAAVEKRSFDELIHSALAGLQKMNPPFADQVFEYLYSPSSSELEPQKILSLLELLQKYQFTELQGTKNALRLWLASQQWIKLKPQQALAWDKAWEPFYVANPQLKWEREIERTFYQRWKHEGSLPQNIEEMKGAFMSKRTLSWAIRERLFDKQGNFKKDPSLTGRSDVTFYPLYNPQFYFKKYPEFAGYEAAATSFLRRWGVAGAPHSDLSVFYDPSLKKLYPVLITEAVPGPLVYQIWDKENALAALDPHHTGLLLLASILLNPEDGKEDNHILSLDGKRLIPIDNDHIFLPGVYYDQTSFGLIHKVSGRLQSKSLLFCLDEMTLPLPSSCINHLLKLLSHEVFLEEWFKELVSINDHYQSLLDEKALAELWKEKGVSLRISLPESVVKSIFWKLELMKELLQDNPSIVPLEILSRLEPYAGKKYQEAFVNVPLDQKRPRNALLKQRFQLRAKDLWAQNKVTNTSLSLLNSRQMVEILNLPDSEIYGSSLKTKIGPSAALDLLDELKEARKTRTVESFLTSKAIDIDASQLTKLQETEQLRKFLNAAQERIAIYNSKVLSSSEVGKYCMIYGGMMRFLDLRGAQNLENKDFETIARECLNLEYLNTSSWPKLKKAIVPEPNYSQALPSLSRLKRWVIKECDALQEIKGELSSLLIFEAPDNVNLANVYIKALKLEKADLSGINTLTDATLQIQGALSLFVKGEVTTKEFKKTYLKAIKGKKSAQNSLGFRYKDGRGVAEDYQKAIKWFKKAADQGDASAQSHLGKMYEWGQEVAQDYEEAFKWYKKAAEQGNASAQNNLGNIYKNGKVVAQDYREAFKWYKIAANQRNAYGQFNLGWMYYHGQGVAQDYELAVEWYKKAADQRNDDAQFNLGCMYYSGQGVTQNYELACEWFKKAADQLNALAQHNLGYMYYSGQGVAQDYELACEWFKKAADQLNALAQHNLGYMYYSGQGVAQDYELACEWYKKAADQGLAQAQINLGWMYYRGNGVNQDYVQALEYYNKASEQKHGLALYQIGFMHNHGLGTIKNEIKAQHSFKKLLELSLDENLKLLELSYGSRVLALLYSRSIPQYRDFNKAFQCLQKSCALNDLYAFALIGRFYKEGHGTDKDLEKAVESLHTSIKSNNEWGQYNLALMYRDGEGVAQDDKEAFKLFLLAAEQGDDNAQYSLAWMYKHGRGTEKNLQKANKWYKTAETRHPHDALYSLGRMYEYGLSVDKDLKKAIYYYKRAADLGDLNAQERLAALKEE